ncbi:MAG: hypothetical protein EBU23_10460, partial [Mycobacteriaceae bacterium]|nr:hypothetical protein [Mycobacteriaceae bacterium]
AQFSMPPVPTRPAPQGWLDSASRSFQTGLAGTGGMLAGAAGLIGNTDAQAGIQKWTSDTIQGLAPEQYARPEASMGEKLLDPDWWKTTAAQALGSGAGSMGALSAAHLVRAGVRRITIVNRSLPRAQRLARSVAEHGVLAEAASLDTLPVAMAEADIVISCTGSVRPVVSLADVHRALATELRDESREDPSVPLVLCDLGMPRDIDPAVAGLPGVAMIDMERVQREPSAQAAVTDAESARRIVGAEVADYLASQRVAEVIPTVTALRQRAADVVGAELLRLENRLPGLAEDHRHEIARMVRRVVDKLLHAPTVRVKQLADAPGAHSYAEALRELFELDPRVVEALAASEIPPSAESAAGHPGSNE